MGFAKQTGDILACSIARLLTGVLNLLPMWVRLSLIYYLIRLVVFVMPRFEKTARRNLEFVFPALDRRACRELIDKSYRSLARVFVDFARLPRLSQSWMREHVACDYLPRLEELKRINPSRGILIATGHLGSFELLAHFTAMSGHPMSFVVRDFKLPRLDRWWRGIREARGNRVISRKGAMEEVFAELRAGRDVALLFDQNVTRNHAVFVSWFGRVAATTRAVALAAIRTRATVLVSAILHDGGDNYRIEVVERDFSSIYDDAQCSTDEKVFRITEIVSRDYQQMILKQPEGWFWMHRRWKTSPAGVAEDFYD